MMRIMTYERSTLVNSERYIGLDVHQATISVASPSIFSAQRPKRRLQFYGTREKNKRRKRNASLLGLGSWREFSECGLCVR